MESKPSSLHETQGGSTNSWFSNYGQLRRSTDRFIAHRLAQVALAVAFILTIKLFAWADRWNR